MKVELESVDHQDRLPLRVFIHSIRRSSLHSHPELEILLVLKGTVSVMIDTRTFLLESGDLVLVNGNTPHLSQDGGDDNVLLAVQIDASFARKYDSEIERRRFAFNEAYAADKNTAVFTRIRGICAELLWETRLKRTGYQIAAESLALELLALLMRGFESGPLSLADVAAAPDPNAANFYARINRMVAGIEREYREKLSLADIARKEGVNMTYLSRFFKEKMGYSFTEFVQFIRLKRTLQLLEESDRKIVDIALDCGFPNVKSYNMVFKRAYKRTPAQWRAERKSRESEDKPADTSVGSGYGAHDDESALTLVRRYLPGEFAWKTAQAKKVD